MRVYPDKAARSPTVLAVSAPGDVVLVKASRGLALDTVAEAILRPLAAAPKEIPREDDRARRRARPARHPARHPAGHPGAGPKGYGQLIRDDGPTSHHVKRGTPTMGGLVIIAAVLIAYFGSHLITWTAPSASALLVLFLFTGLGVVGFLDDFIKISKQRSLGLRSKAKIAGQSVVAIIFALLSLQFPDERGVTPASPSISFLRDIELAASCRWCWWSSG